MRTRSAALIAAGVAAAAVVGAGPAPDGSGGRLAYELEEPARCSLLLGVVPEAVATDHLGGEVLELGVHVLVDSSITGNVGALLSEAAEATYEVGLRTKVRFSYGTASVPGDTVTIDGAFQIARSATGGTPPNGADMVYLLTDNDIVGAAGVANCIGGIQDPSQAYAIGELFEADLDEGSLAGPVDWFHNLTGKVFAHEVGHLLGAHHHQANCVEGIPSDPVGDATGACTLMFNYVDTASYNFSTVNAAVARGHVREFGRRNQR